MNPIHFFCFHNLLGLVSHVSVEKDLNKILAILNNNSSSQCFHIPINLTCITNANTTCTFDAWQGWGVAVVDPRASTPPASRILWSSNDLIGFQCKYTEAPCKAFSPISSLLPQSPTSCVSFLPPSFRYVWNLGVVVNDWPWCGLENRWNNSIIYMKLVWFGWMCYTELQSGPFTEYLALTPFLLMSALEVPLLCDLFE